MLLHITRAHAVDSIYGTALEFIKIARDYLCSSLHIWDYYCYLVLVREFSQALPDTVANFKVTI